MLESANLCSYYFIQLNQCGTLWIKIIIKILLMGLYVNQWIFKSVILSESFHCFPMRFPVFQCIQKERVLGQMLKLLTSTAHAYILQAVCLSFRQHFWAERIQRTQKEWFNWTDLNGSEWIKGRPGWQLRVLYELNALMLLCERHTVPGDFHKQ